MISGYESEMYNDYLNGWKKKQFSSCAEHGKARTETVWMNYESDPQMKLNFFGGAVMIQTAEDKVKEYCQCIRREIEHWKVINQNGCSDPFWYRMGAT